MTFVLSATVLAFLYGYGASTFGWFPHSLVDQAVIQTASYLSHPRYLGPRVHDRSGVHVGPKDRVAPGLTLIATHTAEWNWQPGLRLFDVEGRVVHDWTLNTSEVFGDSSGTYGVRTSDRNIHGSYLFPNGDVLVTVEYTGIARLDACGNVLWRLPNRAHHSIARADDGTFWIPTTSLAAVPTSDRYPEGYPGLDRPVNHDRLLRLTEDGTILDSISVLDALYGNDLVRYLAKAKVPVFSTDLTHINDVEPLPTALADDYPLFEAGDLLVSIRTANLVIVLDPDTEVVKWYASDPFVQQHDPDFIGGGWIGVFDNANDETERGTLLGGSRIVAIQPHTDSSKVLFPTPASGAFYTPYLGKWQLLGNGNMLLTEGRAGRVVEVAPEGHAVWEWVGAPYGEESYAVEVTEGTKYSLTLDEVADWPCRSAEGD